MNHNTNGQICHFIMKTNDRGFASQTNHPGSWDGTRDHLFQISGVCNQDWEKYPSERSIGSGYTLFCGEIIKNV